MESGTVGSSTEANGSNGTVAAAEVFLPQLARVIEREDRIFLLAEFTELTFKRGDERFLFGKRFGRVSVMRR